MPAMGIISCLWSCTSHLDRAEKAGKKSPADERALKEILDAYSLIVKTIWRDKKCFDGSLGEISLIARNTISDLLLRLAIRETEKPG